jgi:hypothetical protein
MACGGGENRRWPVNCKCSCNSEREGCKLPWLGLSSAGETGNGGEWGGREEPGGGVGGEGALSQA